MTTSRLGPVIYKLSVMVLMISASFDTFAQLNYMKHFREFQGVIVYKYEITYKHAAGSTKNTRPLPVPLDSLKIFYRYGSMKVMGYYQGVLENYACYQRNSKYIYTLNRTNDTLIKKAVDKTDDFAYHFDECKKQGNYTPADLKCMVSENNGSVIELYYVPRIIIDVNNFKWHSISKIFYMDYTHSLFLKVVRNNSDFSDIATAYRIERDGLTEDDFIPINLPIIKK
ncbi:MAG: hypothetical protein WCL06_15035 [Bacteroidota bacterium]